MKKQVLSNALNIALLPPLWAVAAPYCGVTVGAVALICAALYALSGGGIRNGLSLSTGFLLGDLWAVASLYLMSALPVSADMSLLLTLIVMGFFAVVFSAWMGKWTSCPAWLCGLAVGLTLLSPKGIGNLGTLPVEIAAAMLAGVWYVGVVGDRFAAWLLRLFRGKAQQ